MVTSFKFLNCNPGSGGSPRSPRNQSPKRTGRFKFLPESLKQVPLFPSARARANTNAPNADEDEAAEFPPDSPLSPSHRAKRSPKAKAALHTSFHFDRSKPKPRLHQGGSEDLHLLTIEGFEAARKEPKSPKDDLPTPSSSFRSRGKEDWLLKHRQALQASNEVGDISA